MKNLLAILVIGSGVALAGVYFELWTIPRLENFPTKSSQPVAARPSLERSARERLDQDMDDAPPSGPLGLDRSKSGRVQQLEDSRRLLGD